eukprot:GHVN01024377.1.p1 GENE.GHVN01024377.1~~GHVN01024377.1.p1  ORF type:complete len:243 (-),score=45.39 GHVN01024377.1:187-915(-)
MVHQVVLSDSMRNADVTLLVADSESHARVVSFLSQNHRAVRFRLGQEFQGRRHVPHIMWKVTDYTRGMRETVGGSLTGVDDDDDDEGEDSCDEEEQRWIELRRKKEFQEYLVDQLKDVSRKRADKESMIEEIYGPQRHLIILKEWQKKVISEGKERLQRYNENQRKKEPFSSFVDSPPCTYGSGRRAIDNKEIVPVDVLHQLLASIRGTGEKETNTKKDDGDKLTARVEPPEDHFARKWVED